MRPLLETVTDLGEGAETLRRRPYGVIEAAGGRFRRVVLRPVPKLISLPEVWLVGRWSHRRGDEDRCRLYYDQPRRFPNFLAVKYIVSRPKTTLGTVCRVLEALDEVARLKGVDALLCAAISRRISTKILARWGWEPHCRSGWQRHYIKRFYGEYPTAVGWIASGAEAVAV